MGRHNEGNIITHQFRSKNQTGHPSPPQESPLQVVPESDKREDDPDVEHPIRRPSKGNVEVPDQPPVEGGVPPAPEALNVVVVVHAAQHVFRWLGAFKHRAAPEVAPNDKKLAEQHRSGVGVMDQQPHIHSIDSQRICTRCLVDSEH